MQTYDLGDRVLDFEAPDQRGLPRALSDLCANQPLVLLTYRGQGCAYCARQLARFAEYDDDIVREGAAIAALSADALRESADLARELEIPFPLLCDPEADVIEKWGLLDPADHRRIARPSTWVIGTDMRVKFVSLETKTERTHPRSVIRFLQTGARTDRFGFSVDRHLTPHPRGWWRIVREHASDARERLSSLFG
jgi:peroxiredoxin Q/BCP